MKKEVHYRVNLFFIVKKSVYLIFEPLAAKKIKYK
jgi:hypothetical protein